MPYAVRAAGCRPPDRRRGGRQVFRAVYLLKFLSKIAISSVSFSGAGVLFFAEVLCIGSLKVVRNISPMSPARKSFKIHLKFLRVCAIIARERNCVPTES